MGDDQAGPLSAEQYRLIAENASDVVFQVGADGILAWVSPSVTRALGWTPEELIGTRPWHAIHPDDRAGAAEVLALAARDSTAEDIELRMLRRDGGSVWMAASGRPLVADGRLQGFVVALKDVDALVAARTAQQAEQERLRATLDSMLDPHAYLQAVREDGRIVDFVYAYANPAACQYLGRDREGLVGHRLSEVLPEDQWRDSLHRYAASMESGEAVVLDDLLFDDALHGGQHAIDVREVPLRDGVSVTWRDVTERHGAAEALAASERTFRMVAENASDVVIQSGTDGLIRWVSPSAQAVFGRAPADLVGTAIADLIHPDDVPRMLEEQQRAIAGGVTTGHVTARFVSAGGGWRWMSDTGRLMLDADGAVIGGIDSLRDVQAEHEAREALLDSEKRFRSAMINAGIGMCLTSRDGAFLEVNPALCRYLGRDEADLKSRTWQELTHPDDLEIDLGHLQQVLEGEIEGYRLHKRFIRADGAVVYGDMTVTGVRHGDGRFAYVIAQIVDVTAEVESRAALQQSEHRFRLLAENSSDVVIVSDQGRARWLSPSVEDVLGWDPLEMVGADLTDYVHPDDRALIERWRSTPYEGEPHRVRFRVRREDGEYRWMESVTHPSVDAEGVQAGWIANLRDVTSEVAAQQALAQSEQLYRLLTEEADDVIGRVSAERVIEYVSPSVERLLGWRPEDLVGTSYSALWHPEDISAVPADDRGVAAGIPIRFRGRIRSREGTYRWVEVNARTVPDQSGGMGGVLVMRDVEEQVRAERDLARSEQRFRLAMESAPTGMAVVDLDRRFVEVNPALCRMLGRDAEWLLHHRIPDVVDPEDDSIDLRIRAEVLSGRTSSASEEKRLVRADGSRFWVEHSVGLLRDDEGTPLSYVSQFVNIDEARRARDELRYMATHDALTRLANRHELLTRMQRLLSFTPRTGTRVGVLFVDLDGLKQVNDRWGHAVGDRVLVELAERMSAQVRTDDVVARIGGDEFVVLLTTIRDQEAASAVAKKVQEATEAPFLVDDHAIEVSVSIGLSVADPGDDPETVIDEADRALYRAKRAGRAQTLAFDPLVDGPDG